MWTVDFDSYDFRSRLYSRDDLFTNNQKKLDHFTKASLPIEIGDAMHTTLVHIWRILSHFTEGFRPLVLKSASKSNVSKYPISHSGVIERIYTKVDVTGTVVRKIARFVLDSTTSVHGKLGFPAF